MQIRFANHRSTAFQLHYDRNGTGGGLNVAVGSNVLVTLGRLDPEHPVELNVTDAGIVVWNERATADVDRPDPMNRGAQYDELGRLADPAEWQQQVMLGLYDILADAGEAEFAGELLDDLNRVRLRFMDAFEDRFPNYGKGRAVWR